MNKIIQKIGLVVGFCLIITLFTGKAVLASSKKTSRKAPSQTQRIDIYPGQTHLTVSTSGKVTCVFHDVSCFHTKLTGELKRMAVQMKMLEDAINKLVIVPDPSKSRGNRIKMTVAIMEKDGPNLHKIYGYKDIANNFLKGEGLKDIINIYKGTHRNVSIIHKDRPLYFYDCYTTSQLVAFQRKLEGVARRFLKAVEEKEKEIQKREGLVKQKDKK